MIFIISHLYPTQINVFVSAGHTHKPLWLEMHWVTKSLEARVM